MSLMWAIFSQLLMVWLLPHGELDDRIRLLSAQIEANPHDFSLRVERGELYVLDELYDLAINDFVICLQHPPVPDRAYAGYSKALFHTQRIDSALLMINQAIEINGSHMMYYEWKAVVLEELEDYCEAAKSQEFFLHQITQPGPAVYLQLADYWKNCDEGIEKAISVLEKGAAELPHNIVLTKKLVSCLLSNNNYAAALNYQNQIVENASFKARHLLERAGIYELLGQKENAINDLNQALHDLDALPQNKKDLAAMQKLRDDITSSLIKIQP